MTNSQKCRERVWSRDCRTELPIRRSRVASLNHFETKRYGRLRTADTRAKRAERNSRRDGSHLAFRASHYLAELRCAVESHLTRLCVWQDGCRPIFCSV